MMAERSDDQEGSTMADGPASMRWQEPFVTCATAAGGTGQVFRGTTTVGRMS